MITTAQIFLLLSWIPIVLLASAPLLALWALGWPERRRELIVAAALCGAFGFAVGLPQVVPIALKLVWAVLLGIAALLMGAVALLWRARRRLLGLGAGLLLAAACHAALGPPYGVRFLDRAAIERKAASTIAAIEAYRASSGGYPDSLTQAGEQPPSTHFGRMWYERYRDDGGADGFRLCAGRIAHNDFRYCYERGSWRVLDKS